MSSPPTKRLFIAVRPGPELTAELELIQEGLQDSPFFYEHRSECRWLPPANLHLTLHFLGEVEPEPQEKLLQELAELRRHPMSLQEMDELLFFPIVDKARVGGVGSRKPVPQLVGLHRAIGAVVEKIGLPVESRPYIPHLSLVRFRSPLEIPHYSISAPVVFPVCGFTVYESRLGREGSCYEIVGEFPLLV